jgi:hypothetical protein
MCRPVDANSFMNSPRSEDNYIGKEDTKDNGEYKPEFEPNTTSKWKPNECLKIGNSVRPAKFPLLLGRIAPQTRRRVSLQTHTCTRLLLCNSAVGIYTA